jgi:hypothetical protein
MVDEIRIGRMVIEKTALKSKHATRLVETATVQGYNDEKE